MTNEYRDFTAKQYKTFKCTSYTGGASWLRSKADNGFFVVSCTPVEILRYFEQHPDSTVRGQFIADKPELDFDRINHGPFDHPVSEPSDELPGSPYFYHYEPTTGREVTVTIRLAGEFAVELTNTDNEKSVVKVFPSSARNEAIAYAKSFVGL